MSARRETSASTAETVARYWKPALGVGVVALGIATYLFFARPTKVVEVRSATAGFTRTRSGGLGTVGFTF